MFSESDEFKNTVKQEEKKKKELYGRILKAANNIFKNSFYGIAPPNKFNCINDLLGFHKDNEYLETQ